MGFFKEFKDDFSYAADEMITTNQENTGADNDMINTITDNVNVEEELSKLDGLLEKAAQKVSEEPGGGTAASSVDTYSSGKSQEVLNDISPRNNAPVHNQNQTPVMPASDETAVITSGMIITGDIETTGSIEVQGRVNGNVTCQGKLTVTGMITGNSAASEVFADAARVDGEINASGTIKVGAGRVVIGNVSATSAVIAGAIKGDIDVQGPVVVDTSAVVMGNVKSKSVQINNGAVIEGFCSQAYADTDVSALFSE